MLSATNGELPSPLLAIREKLCVSVEEFSHELSGGHVKSASEHALSPLAGDYGIHRISCVEYSHLGDSRNMHCPPVEVLAERGRSPSSIRKALWI